MGGQARIQSCQLSTSASFPGSMPLQPEQIGCALSVLLVRSSPHICISINSYGTKTKILKIIKKKKSPFVCPCYSCRPYQHVQWYFHMCICFTYFSYFYFFYNCCFNSTLFHQLLLSVWIHWLSSLPILAVVIYSEHFHMDSYPLILNAALGFILGMPPFI